MLSNRVQTASSGREPFRRALLSTILRLPPRVSTDAQLHDDASGRLAADGDVCTEKREQSRNSRSSERSEQARQSQARQKFDGSQQGKRRRRMQQRAAKARRHPACMIAPADARNPSVCCNSIRSAAVVRRAATISQERSRAHHRCRHQRHVPKKTLGLDMLRRRGEEGCFREECSHLRKKEKKKNKSATFRSQIQKKHGITKCRISFDDK